MVAQGICSTTAVRDKRKKGICRCSLLGKDAEEKVGRVILHFTLHQRCGLHKDNFLKVNKGIKRIEKGKDYLNTRCIKSPDAFPFLQSLGEESNTAQF